MRVGIIDYRMGNLASVSKALEAAGAEALVSADEGELSKTDLLVLPGVGNFAAGMANLDEADLAGFTVDWAQDGRPLLGICLGHQLLGLATGHETFKLPFGHRGANHPVLERRSGRVLVTSQNHGFAVAPSDDAEATHVSLYDGTVEGFDFPELRARSVQFHPEAGPGPHDSVGLFDDFIAEMTGAHA